MSLKRTFLALYTGVYSHEYYPVFRCVFMIALFFTLYGTDLLIWRRMHINYHAVLGVSVHHSYRKYKSTVANICILVTHQASNATALL